MKKFIIIIFSVFLIFAACAENSVSVPKLSIPLKVTAKLSGSEACFTAIIREAQCEITFEHKHSLTGTILNFDENGGKATVGDFTREIEFSSFPAQNALVKALRGIYQSPHSGVKTDNATKYTIDEMTIMVYYNEDTDEIIGITTEEGGRRFEFTVVALESI